MESFTVTAYLDDGPRAGQTLSVHTGPNGQPPSQVVAPEPRDGSEPTQESIEVGHGTDRTTTYHLHSPATADNTYIYRTSQPHHSPGSDDRGGTEEQLDTQRWVSEGGAPH